MNDEQKKERALSFVHRSSFIIHRLLLVLLLRLVAEIGLEEVVDVAVEDVLGLGRFDAGAAVADQGVRLQDVVADLVAPGHLALLVVLLLDLGLDLLLLDGIEASLEQLHRVVVVLVLAALGATLAADSSRQMDYPHARLRLVLVLPAGTARGESLLLDVGILDLD